MCGFMCAGCIGVCMSTCMKKGRDACVWGFDAYVGADEEKMSM